MKKQNRKNGFVVMSALILAGLVFVGSLIVLAFKGAIDKDLAMMSTKQAVHLAEDTLKSSIQLQIGDLNSLADIRNYILGLNSFSVPVPGTSCDNANTPCSMRVKAGGISFAEEPPGSGDEYAIIVLTYDGNDVDKIKTKVKDISLRILLPKVTVFTATVPTDIALQTECLGLENPWVRLTCANYMRNNFCLNNPSHEKCTNLNPLVCPQSTPIFLGTKYDNDGIERAICRPVPGQNIHVSSGPIEVVKCNVNAGRWLSEVRPNLSLACLDYPNGIQEQNQVQFCQDANQIAKNYELDENFNVINLKCVNRGGPYDFLSETRTWD